MKCSLVLTALGTIVAVLIAACFASADEVVFTFDPGGSMEIESVSVRGSFNGWGETAMEPGGEGIWSVTIDLEPGEYQYKYFINGEWPGDMSSWLDGEPADPLAEDYVDDGYGGQNAVRIVGGAPKVETEREPAPPLAEGSARIRYHRPKGGYGGWGLHVWGDTEESVLWTEPLPPAGQDPYGLYWDIRLTEGAAEVGFIIHKGDTKDPGPDMLLSPAEHGTEVWLVSGSPNIMTSEPDISVLALGDLARSTAHWVDARTIAWKTRPPDGAVFRLHSSRDADLALAADGISGGEVVALTLDPNGLSRGILARFPHLKGAKALRLPDDALDSMPGLLKGQLAVSMSGADGALLDATALQIPGVLDDLFAYDGPLGVEWNGGVPTLRVWAPTAQQVWVHLFDDTAADAAAVLPMIEEAGVWSLTGEVGWKGKYYLYEIKVFHPATGMVERSLATDPYSRGLSMNSTRTQIVDLDDPALKPDGWDDLGKPPLKAPEDIVLYELHVRDFSASDPTVPEPLVGTFRAFTIDSNGTKHLSTLADAGLTHVHILPAFDIATINEDKSTWKDPGDLSVFPPNSKEQQAAVSAVSGEDAYNWGYDPFHYGVPEGSYSTDPDGPQRIIEFREMVQALSGMGLRVVMDVVYNHTNSSGINEKSVLDKIVPGYYHRLNADGFVETSTCCQNTATEHVMMERLMIDDLVHWARDYKVDGFRFDLMGHHMKRNMEKAQDALHALTVESDGVDGGAIYLYGEGWDFGEVQGGKRGVNATQLTMAGTGIGSFNDRIRDAVRGGSAFSDRREQGFATGLYYDPSGYNRAGAQERDALLDATDRIRIGLTGNLRGYGFVDRSGRQVTGGQIAGTGYAAQPRDAIAYVSAHDNETFFDKIQYAAPSEATLEDRLRMQMMGVSITACAQGIPFFHAGVDILRSKSLDADSYNSGDHFNRLDWTYETNNFGVGLPVAEKNRDRWSIIAPLLARSEITPGRDEITAMSAHFRRMLSVRRSSPLFRLKSAKDVMARVTFHNTGTGQVPGVIAMGISDVGGGLPDIDPDYARIVVLFNATTTEQSFLDDAWADGDFVLHPILAECDDRVSESLFEAGAFTVPARTTAVFVEPQ